MPTPPRAGLRLLVVLIAAAALIAGCGSKKKSDTTSTNVTGGTGQVVDGVPCNSTEQLTYHVHAHIWLLNDGKSEPLPALIGIIDGGQCFYFLHTHDTTGVIHIEAPKKRTFTLGQFFDIWGQPLGPKVAANLTGTLHVFVGKKPYTGNPRNIPLLAHQLITVESGKKVTPPGYTFPAGL